MVTSPASKLAPTQVPLSMRPQLQPRACSMLASDRVTVCCRNPAAPGWGTHGLQVILCSPVALQGLQSTAASPWAAPQIPTSGNLTSGTESTSFYSILTNLGVCRGVSHTSTLLSGCCCTGCFPFPKSVIQEVLPLWMKCPALDSGSSILEQTGIGSARCVGSFTQNPPL